MVKIYTRLSEQSDDYAYLGNIRKVQDRIHDVDYLIDCSPYVTMGTPADFLERGRRLFEMGADEWVLRVDGMGHEAHARTLRMLGEHVLPELHKPHASRDPTARHPTPKARRRPAPVAAPCLQLVRPARPGLVRPAAARRDARRTGSTARPAIGSCMRRPRCLTDVRLCEMIMRLACRTGGQDRSVTLSGRWFAGE